MHTHPEVEISIQPIQPTGADINTTHQYKPLPPVKNKKLQTETLPHLSSNSSQQVLLEQYSVETNLSSLLKILRYENNTPNTQRTTLNTQNTCTPQLRATKLLIASVCTALTGTGVIIEAAGMPVQIVIPPPASPPIEILVFLLSEEPVPLLVVVLM
jgi:hypothetical protein